MEKREEEWRKLHQKAVLAILNGRCSCDFYGEMSISSIVSEAISGADILVKELKEREEAEEQ